jgi:hypothetical protein
MQLVETGDDLVRNERFKEARTRYEQAQKIDRDNELIPGRIATAERFDREARSRNIRATLGFAVPLAVQTLNEYFEYKQEEERRKREEEIRKREEAEREAEEDRERRRGRRR